jgi:hypothetical protein
MSNDYRDSEAPFNMAVATLMRLDAILQQIKNVCIIYPPHSVEKQRMHIELVKQFYMNSITLLEKTEDKDYEKLLNFEMKVKSIIRNKVQIVTEIYSKEIEKELNRILIKLQIQTKKYYMPKGKDTSRAVTNIG